MLVTIIAGARPNFMKIAPLVNAIQMAKSKGNNIDFRLVHTGQHFDKKMSGDFFEQLGIPEPHANLEAGGGSQAQQTAAIMVRFEEELVNNNTDISNSKSIHFVSKILLLLFTFFFRNSFFSICVSVSVFELSCCLNSLKRWLVCALNLPLICK